MEIKLKFIYETIVKKVIQDTKQEIREENGKSVTVSTPIETIKNIKIAISKPDRKKFKEAEIHYAIRLSYYLKAGLLPYSLVSKRYVNDGGPLSENEKKVIQTIREKYTELQSEYFAMKEPLSDANKTRRGQIILEMGDINNMLQEYQNAYASIFENTAEAKAKSDTIEFWILNNSYIDLDDKGYKCLYGDGDLETKCKVLEELESKEDNFTNEVIKKLSYFISFWHTIGGNFKTEDFASAEENYEKNITNYLKPKELEEGSPAISAPIISSENPTEPLSEFGSSIKTV